MKIGIMISSLLLTIAVISGCADVSTTNKEANLQEKNTVNEKKAIKTSTSTVIQRLKSEGKLGDKVIIELGGTNGPIDKNEIEATAG